MDADRLAKFKDEAERDWFMFHCGARDFLSLVARLEAAEEVLRWLDIQGGLGYDKHNRIRAALAGEKHVHPMTLREIMDAEGPIAGEEKP